MGEMVVLGFFLVQIENGNLDARVGSPLILIPASGELCSFFGSRVLLPVPGKRVSLDALSSLDI